MLVLLQTSQKQVIWLMSLFLLTRKERSQELTFTILEGEEAQKWYDKAGEEDQQEAAEEASTQSIEDAK